MISLKAARAWRLLSIRDLAAAAQVAPSTVYLLEHGRAVARPSTRRKLAGALGIAASEIVELAPRVPLTAP